MDLEFGNAAKFPKKESWKNILLLAYQSLGVVYGDLSISPLYVYKSTFAEDITHSETNEEIYGVLSFVFWTLTLIPLIKYVFIVLRADDNGQGGTFALYSMICRHANVSLLPNKQVSDEELSTYKVEHSLETKGKSRIKNMLEKHKNLHTALLLVVMLGTCMVIGDGVLTPALSVFSAVSGLELSISKEHYERSEAMFADLGHFSHIAIQVAFTSFVYPALVLGYMGQTAYLSKHHGLPAYQIGFFATVPESVRWPVLVVAILAAVVGSQTIISGSFSIINQSQSLGCFPRVKVVHTSDKIHGQIYIPEINWMLMILCLAVAVGFRDTKHMGNASGLAAISVMLVTTCLTSLVIVLCWNKPPLLALVFFLVFGSIESLYLLASLIKFLEGAWVPILLAFLLMTIMFLWHYATIQKYQFDLQNKVSLDWLLALGESLGVTRVPGIGLVYTDLISGVPSNFSHFITNLPAFHRILVFVCVKYIPVPFVPTTERYLVGRVGPPDHRSYRCIVRYGYRDVHQDVDSFESELISSLADFIRLESSHRVDNGLTVVGRTTSSCSEIQEVVSEGNVEVESEGRAKKVRFFIEEDERSTRMDRRMIEELRELQDACESGTAFIMGHSHVRTKSGSSIIKKLAIEVGYNFLKRNCRGPDVALRVPPASLLEVGMVYVL